MQQVLKEALEEGIKRDRVKERRGRLEICADILSVAVEAVTKTELLDKANINFYRIENYLSYLEGKELIANIRGEYNTTEKGKEFLRDYQRVKEQIS
jgi:predicted transcriptional regulator